jgi:hypothetical protein
MSRSAFDIFTNNTQTACFKREHTNCKVGRNPAFGKHMASGPAGSGLPFSTFNLVSTGIHLAIRVALCTIPFPTFFPVNTGIADTWQAAGCSHDVIGSWLLLANNPGR